MTETIATGKKYRICTDPQNDLWTRVSFWTKASDVEMENGATVETEINNLKNKVFTIPVNPSSTPTEIGAVWITT